MINGPRRSRIGPKLTEIRAPKVEKKNGKPRGFLDAGRDASDRVRDLGAVEQLVAAPRDDHGEHGRRQRDERVARAAERRPVPRGRGRPVSENPLQLRFNMTLYESMRAIFVSRSRERVQR